MLHSRKFLGLILLAVGCTADVPPADGLAGGPPIVSRGIGRSFDQCIRPIGIFRDKLREGEARSGVRIRVAEAPALFGGTHRLEVAGEDSSLEWVSLTLPAPTRATGDRVSAASMAATGLLTKCGSVAEGSADDEWLVASTRELLAAPGVRSRTIGPRVATLSRDSEHDILLTIRSLADTLAIVP